MERLDKVLSHHGYGTRKDVKRLCYKGFVQINGKPNGNPAAHIDIDKDIVTVDGVQLKLQHDVYIMMNKCKDVVCANKDGEHETVFDLLDENLRHKFMGGDLHCMGRLDMDTEGLLIITSDGQLTHRLLAPKTHVPKTYAVGLRDKVTPEKQAELTELFKKGFHIDREQNEADFDCSPSELQWINNELKNDNGELKIDKSAATGEASLDKNRLMLAAAQNSTGKADCFLTIYEGKYHQVKRMFAQIGNEVVYLKRVAMGDLILDSEIKLGEYRELKENEIELLTAGNQEEEE